MSFFLSGPSAIVDAGVGTANLFEVACDANLAPSNSGSD
jgi:hypothetical protein